MLLFKPGFFIRTSSLIHRVPESLITIHVLQSFLLYPQDRERYGCRSSGPSLVTDRHFSILHRNCFNDNDTHLEE